MKHCVILNTKNRHFQGAEQCLCRSHFTRYAFRRPLLDASPKSQQLIKDRQANGTQSLVPGSTTVSKPGRLHGSNDLTDLTAAQPSTRPDSTKLKKQKQTNKPTPAVYRSQTSAIVTWYTPPPLSQTLTTPPPIGSAWCWVQHTTYNLRIMSISAVHTAKQLEMNERINIIHGQATDEPHKAIL